MMFVSDIPWSNQELLAPLKHNAEADVWLACIYGHGGAGGGEELIGFRGLPVAAAQCTHELFALGRCLTGSFVVGIHPFRGIATETDDAALVGLKSTHGTELRE